MGIYLQRFKQQGIRNLAPLDITLDSQLNIFYGDNGAGKSSVLEALCLLTTGRSFRTSKFEHIINKTSDDFFVFSQSNQSLQLGLGFNKPQKKKSIKVNGEIERVLSNLSKQYPTQIISPESYHLIDSGPSERRKYLDWSLFHVEHSYIKYWKSLSVLIKQRNALLKNNTENSQSIEQLDVWDMQLCQLSEIITSLRKSVLTKIEALLNDLLLSLDVDFKGVVKLNYYSGYSGELNNKLQENRSLDFLRGTTSVGPHKADIKIKVDNQLAKDFLSRGQKKLLINCLFLAQTLLLKQETQKDSLFIIDDFSSELDEQNQEALLETLLAQKNVQIILSCLHLDSLKWLKTRYNMAQLFHVEHGAITPQSLNETV